MISMAMDFGFFFIGLNNKNMKNFGSLKYTNSSFYRDALVTIKTKLQLIVTYFPFKMQHFN